MERNFQLFSEQRAWAGGTQNSEPKSFESNLLSQKNGKIGLFVIRIYYQMIINSELLICRRKTSILKHFLF